jgi:hypothetical protein
MSSPDDEPEAVITDRKGQVVASGRNGTRILVPPGSYDVRIGSGGLVQSVSLPVTIEEGGTILLPVHWGGLIIEVLDETNVPFRGEYELIRLEDREVIGLGFGANTLLGEQLRTWLLRPGLYQIVRPGETYRARTDFATVFVPEEGLVHFKLVLEPLSGDFRGSGVVYPGDLNRPIGVQAWASQMVLGFNMGLSESDHVVGVADQLVLSGDFFLDGYAAYEQGSQSFVGLLALEEGGVLVDPAEGAPLPVQQSKDRLRIDAVYTFYFNDWVGPYLALGNLTSLFPARVIATDDMVVRRIFADGSRADIFIPASGAHRTSGPLGSVQFSEGIGLNLRLIRSRNIDSNFRLGLGLRQTSFNEAFVQDDNSTTPEVEFRELVSFNQEGYESVLTATVRILGNLTYTTEAEVFTDFVALNRPTLSWQNTVSLRLAAFASIDYSLDVIDSPKVSDELQITQNVLLRMAWNIF